MMLVILLMWIGLSVTHVKRSKEIIGAIKIMMIIIIAANTKCHKNCH